MGQKKGKVPKYIQSKVFSHPQAESSWIAVLGKVDDPPKVSCNTRHSVTSFLFIAFTTILYGELARHALLSLWRGFLKMAELLRRSYWRDYL